MARAPALLLALLLAGCSPTPDEQIAKKRESIEALELQRRDVVVTARQRIGSNAADQARYGKDAAIDKAAAESERTDAALDAARLKDIDAAVARLADEIAQIESERTPYRGIWLGEAPGKSEKRVSWKAVLADPDFARQDPAAIERGRVQYWQDYVAPMIPTDKLYFAKIAFDRDTKTR